MKKKKPKRCSSMGCNNGFVVKKKAKQQMNNKRIIPKCNFEGCTNLARNGGVCVTHGAKVEVKRCSFEGCTNQVINGSGAALRGVPRMPGGKEESVSLMAPW
jgi:hypothetical protein